MPLSKVALMCLETSPLLTSDILFSKCKLSAKRRKRGLKSDCTGVPKVSPSVFPPIYWRLRENPDEFFSNVNVSLEIFDYILEFVREDLKTLGTYTVNTMPEEKLFMTLRFLRGVPIKKLAITFNTIPSTAFKIVFVTLEAIWRRLSPYHLRDPTHTEMNNLAKEYNEKWRFPNCVGAIGGKYIRILNPSMGTNQKVIVNAIVDANFRFLGANVIRRRNSEDSFVRNIFKITGMQCLPGTEIMLPLVMIGNEAYPLKTNLMKPYPSKASSGCVAKEIFNERLKQARVPVDCAFEILTEKWKIYTRPFTLNLADTRSVVKVTCLLHNIIKDREGDRDPHFSKFGHVDNGIIYLNLVTHKSRRNNRASSIAISIREQLKEYIQSN